MELRVLLLFTTMMILLALTPGPAVLSVLSNALARGTRKSIPMILGINAGNTIYFVLSGTGIGALLIASYQVFSVVRWIGAAYLIWLGLAAIFGKHGPLTPHPEKVANISGWKTFWNGVVVQLSNPKALIFFTAIAPQFISPQRNLVVQLTIIAIVNVLCDFAALLLYAMLAGRVTHLNERPRFRRIADTTAGVMLISAGILTARLRKA